MREDEPAAAPVTRPARLGGGALAGWLVLGAGLLLAAAGALTGAGTIGFAGRWIAIAGLCVHAVRRRSLTTWILVSMIVGAEIGHDWPEVAVSLRVLSQIFLRMIKTIIAPLLFGTLVVGIAGHADLKQVGRMGVKALVYFEVITTLALFIGLLAINLTQAGVGVEPPAALARLGDDKRRPMLAFAQSLSETMFKFTNIVMYFAPVGVGAAIAYTVGHMGLGILANLFKLLATLYLALAAFLLLVLLPVAVLARVPWKRFLAGIAEPVSIAFA